MSEEKIDDFVPNMYGTLFVLGNGFDLDLGFRTRYQDFFESRFYPFSKERFYCDCLGAFVDESIAARWYDLENVLADYGIIAQDAYFTRPGLDYKQYHKIIDGVAEYLSSIDLSCPNHNSVAARILKAADDPFAPPIVYTFNYTDYEKIAESIGVTSRNVYHIHGSLKNHDIILGVGDYITLRYPYSFLHKTSSKDYHSTALLNALESAEDIIIFGCSMSQVDYPYFEDFFKVITSGRAHQEQRRYIRIFTYDEGSRMDILNNLRNMNRGLIKLMGKSDFDIVRTKDNMDEAKVISVVEHLSNHFRVGLS